jgi:glycerol-3-phosphate dehydrogenase
MGIAEWVRDALAAAGLEISEPGAETELTMPNIGEFGTRPYQDAELIGRDADYGRIVCFCERVTRGEIDAALASPIPPGDADGLRRRTRVLMGRCQGFFCGAEVAAAIDGGRDADR